MDLGRASTWVMVNTVTLVISANDMHAVRHLAMIFIYEHVDFGLDLVSAPRFD